MIRRIFKGVKPIQIISLSAFAVLIASVLGVGYLLLQDRDRVSNNNDRLIQIYDDLYRQSQAEGIEPTTPDPSSVKNDSQAGVISGPQGATGAAGRAPTDAEIAAAVRSYCANDNCMGERGQAGATGPAGESITGPKGDAGIAGKDGQSVKGDTGAAGKDSTVPGPQGPAGPAGANGSPGADGAPGATGATGPAGNGIVSITCDGNVLMVKTTDGGTSTFILGTSCMAAQ